MRRHAPQFELSPVSSPGLGLPNIMVDPALHRGGKYASSERQAREYLFHIQSPFRIGSHPIKLIHFRNCHPLPVGKLLRAYCSQNFGPVVSVAEPSSMLVFAKKGGEGVFLRKIPRMLLMGFELGGGYLCVFARFCDTFRNVLARAEPRGRAWIAGMEAWRQRAGWCLQSRRRAWRLRRFFGYFLALCLPSGVLILLCAFGG